MNLPDDLREQVRERLWSIADEVGWQNLSPVAKSKYYTDWTGNPTVGGVLARFMDRGRVRVYIKDSLLKDYGRERVADVSRILLVLHLPETTPIAETYLKPHGRRLADGRLVAWGRADAWKVILMALHERSFGLTDIQPFAAVLLGAAGRFSEDTFRAMVEDAARRLSVEQVVWLRT